MKKRILFVHIALWIGGIETALTSMLDRIDYDSYDVDCLILSDQQELAYRIPRQCKLIVADRQHPVTFPNAYQFKWLFKLLEEPTIPSWRRNFRYKVTNICFRALEERLYSNYIRDNIGDVEYDSVVLFSSKVCGIGCKVFKGKRFICFYHYSDLRRVYHDTSGYKKCSRIFAVSQNLSNRLKGYLPQYADKIEPLHNLVDVRWIRNKSSEEIDFLLSASSFNIVSCGRLVADKGFDLAIEACRKLVKEGSRSIQWYIVGDGPDKEKLQAAVETSGMLTYIHFVGMQENPYPYMKQADLFVQPSRIEAFGLTITEALVLGRPVLATKTDGAAELISDRVNGMLCDISADSLKKGIQELMEDSELRNRIAVGAASIDFERRNNEVMQRLYAEFE